MARPDDGITKVDVTAGRVLEGHVGEAVRDRHGCARALKDGKHGAAAAAGLVGDLPAPAGVAVHDARPFAPNSTPTSGQPFARSQ
jgi:hypothetical protein